MLHIVINILFVFSFIDNVIKCWKKIVPHITQIINFFFIIMWSPDQHNVDNGFHISHSYFLIHIRIVYNKEYFIDKNNSAYYILNHWKTVMLWKRGLLMHKKVEWKFCVEMTKWLFQDTTSMHYCIIEKIV